MMLQTVLHLWWGSMLLDLAVALHVHSCSGLHILHCIVASDLHQFCSMRVLLLACVLQHTCDSNTTA